MDKPQNKFQNRQLKYQNTSTCKNKTKTKNSKPEEDENLKWYDR
eukprot:UN20705